MVTLPNGLKIVNCTPHPLTMAYQQEIIQIPVDISITAKTIDRTVKDRGLYRLVEITFQETEEGRAAITHLRKSYPGAILIGSVIAAKVYPGEIYSPIRTHSARYDKSNYIICSDRFTIFNSKEN